MAGFMAQLVLPFSSQAQKTAFTQWLDNNVVSSGDENEIRLRNSIRELPSRSPDFERLLLQASELISQNREDFLLLFSGINENEQESTPASWLISQWNAFQNQQSATHAVVHEIGKQSHKILASGQISPFLTWPGSTFLPASFHLLQAACSPFTGWDFLPFVNSISINAP